MTQPGEFSCTDQHCSKFVGRLRMLTSSFLAESQSPELGLSEFIICRLYLCRCTIAALPQPF